MERIISMLSIAGWLFLSESKRLLDRRETLKEIRSRISDLETPLDNLSEELKSLRSRILEADRSVPQSMVCDEQSSGKSSAFEAVHQRLFPPSSIFWKPRIRGNLTRMPSLESCFMDHSSSVKRAKVLYATTRLAGEIGSLREILNGVLKKLMRNAKRLFSDTYDSVSSRGGFAIQFEQQLQPGEKVFGRSLLEGLRPRSLNVEFPCSFTWNPVDIFGNACIVCDTAEGILDVAFPRAHPHFGTEFGLDEYTTTAQSQFRCLIYSHELLIGEYDHSDTNSLSDSELKAWLENWKQLNSHTQTQPGIVPLLDRLGTLSPEPSKSQLYSYQRHPQRGCGIFPNAREPKIMKTYDAFIGDEGFGLNFGKPNMGREDDDDDNCVGFRRFSGPAKRSSALFRGGEHHGRARGNHLLGADQRGTIPRFGPPKRDPVAAAMGGNVKRSADETTLAIWRDAITRTCGRNTGFGPMAAKKWEQIGWKSAWKMHANPRREGGLMCAY